MSIAVTSCPHCGTQNISTAQFCGGCGASIVPENAPLHPQTKTHPGEYSGGVAPTAPSSTKEWHQTAGLICGGLSIFLCGIFAAIPGLFFSWSALSEAKRQGKPTGLAITGLVVNGLGVLATIAMAGIMLLSIMMASATAPQGTPSGFYDNPPMQQQLPVPYEY